ncbi:MAG: adenine phosphoribosyltransferase [Phycisphaerales bacterium]|nr:adenine phosphoribosyltransferase [Phycisphaerales bacterium]
MANSLGGTIERLRGLIRDVPDFPKPGILFRDVTPLLADPAAFALAIELIAQPFRSVRIDRVLGVESRGFIFGTAVADHLSAGFMPVRKPGKLPRPTRRHEYELEYGTDALEVHAEDLLPGQRVLVVDDLLATGGTINASCSLAEGLGAEVVGIAVLIELTALSGRERVGDRRVHSVLAY